MARHMLSFFLRRIAIERRPDVPRSLQVGKLSNPPKFHEVTLELARHSFTLRQLEGCHTSIGSSHVGVKLWGFGIPDQLDHSHLVSGRAATVIVVPQAFLQLRERGLAPPHPFHSRADPSVPQRFSAEVVPAKCE